MLRILGRKTSSNVQKVLWLCGELNLEFEREDIGGPFGGNREPGYLALNPNGRVPTVVDGDLVLWESNAILRYLAGREGATHLLPADPRARAEVERWMDWDTSTATPHMAPVYRQVIKTPESERDQAFIEKHWQEWCGVMEIPARRLEQERFLAGDHFTLADIALGVITYRWFNIGLDHPGLGGLERWYRQLGEREPYRQHVMTALE